MNSKRDYSDFIAKSFSGSKADRVVSLILCAARGRTLTSVLSCGRSDGDLCTGTVTGVSPGIMGCGGVTIAGLSGSVAKVIISKASTGRIAGARIVFCDHSLTVLHGPLFGRGTGGVAQHSSRVVYSSVSGSKGLRVPIALSLPGRDNSDGGVCTSGVV